MNNFAPKYIKMSLGYLAERVEEVKQKREEKLHDNSKKLNLKGLIKDIFN